MKLRTSALRSSILIGIPVSIYRCLEIETRKHRFANNRELLLTVLTYLKLELKRVLLVDTLRRTITSDSFLGLNVNFFNYKAFTALFLEVFVFNSYYFEAITSRPFIIDCGSNIGMAMLFFKKIYPDCEIIAFEPDRVAFQMLKRNVAANNMDEVQIENAALRGSEGLVDLYSDPNQIGSVITSTHEEIVAHKVPNPTHNTARALTLSTFIEKEVDFLKMDVEGDEHEVLVDLDKTQKIALVKEMVIEYHHHINKREDKLSTILHILEANNFGYQIVTDRPYFGRQAYQNLVIFAYRKAE